MSKWNRKTIRNHNNIYTEIETWNTANLSEISYLVTFPKFEYNNI